MPESDAGKQEFLGPEPHLLVQAPREPLSEIQPEPHGSERNCFFPWSVEGTVAQPTLHVPQKVTTALRGWSLALSSGTHMLLGHLRTGSSSPHPHPKGDEAARLAALAHRHCCPAGLSTWEPRGRTWRPGIPELPGT